MSHASPSVTYAARISALYTPAKTKRPAKSGAFWGKPEGLRNSADLDRVRPLRAVSDLKGKGVTFAKFVERNSYELVRVEEEILLLTITFDEPETFVGKTGDCSCLHVVQ